MAETIPPRRRRRARHSEPAAAQTGYLTFRLGSEALGVELTAVREILKLVPETVTPLYRVEPYLLGLINLRGQIRPLVDLGLLLGLGATRRQRAADGEFISALILTHAGNDLIAAVDTIAGVRWAGTDALGEVPALARDGLRRFLRAALLTGRQPVSLLAVDQFFAPGLWEHTR